VFPRKKIRPGSRSRKKTLDKTKIARTWYDSG
jgi:hypothetical protein